VHKKETSMRMKHMFSKSGLLATSLSLAVLLAGCIETSPSPSPGGSGPSPTSASRGTPTARQLDPQQAQRLHAVMTPLLQKMDHPIAPNQVRIGVMDDPNINAANAGGGEFYVTSGLLQKANDEQLAGVMAHEIAHADLGHVTRLQTIGAGVNIATVLLDALGVPGAGLVPVAGDLLVARPYSRDAEYAADRHGAELLQRTGQDGKRIMADTLTWLMQAAGPGGGGFFATHPGTEDRIQKVRSM
jgi:predicted Zn-dependent protease